MKIQSYYITCILINREYINNQMKKFHIITIINEHTVDKILEGYLIESYYGFYCFKDKDNQKYYYPVNLTIVEEIQE